MSSLHAKERLGMAYKAVAATRGSDKKAVLDETHIFITDLLLTPYAALLFCLYSQ